MRIIAAYLLAVLGGNENPDSSTIKRILDSVQIPYDEKRVEQLCEELKGKRIDEVIAEGKNKLASVGSVAAPAAGGSAPATGSSSAGGSAPAPDKKDAKSKGDDDDEEGGGGGGMGGLFGDEEEDGGGGGGMGGLFGDAEED